MSKTERTQLSRRRLFAGVGTAGALAATATALPLLREAGPAEPVARTLPQPGDGYRLTEHVLQYYRTAKV